MINPNIKKKGWKKPNRLKKLVLAFAMPTLNYSPEKHDIIVKNISALACYFIISKNKYNLKSLVA
jgi:hypothetical protein